MQCCVGGTQQEFSCGNSVEKWTGVTVFGDRRGRCSCSDRRKGDCVLNRLMLKGMSKQRGESFSSEPADI